MRGLIAAVLLATAGCVGLRDGPQVMNDRASVAELRARISALTDEGFDGGLTRDEVAIADALAVAAWDSGVARAKCTAAEFPSSDQDERLSAITGNAVLDLLQRFITNGTHKQKAVSLLAVARIGSGGRFNHGFLMKKNLWSSDALEGAFCMGLGGNHSTSLVEFNWPEVDLKARSPKTAARLLDPLIDKMLDRSRLYPSGAFVDVFPWLVPDSGMPEESARLLPILEDDDFGEDLRRQVIEFFGLE